MNPIKSWASLDPLFRWILLGLLLLGSPFTLIGAHEAVETSAELRRSVRVSGTVVENRLVRNQRDGVEEDAYLPVVEFRTSTDRVTRFTDPVGRLPPDYAVGEHVYVAFDPADPRRARIISWKRLWLVPTLFVVVGLLPCVVCALILLRVSHPAGGVRRGHDLGR